MTEEGIGYLKRAVEEGHAIGMHTYCHDYKKIYASVGDFLEDYDKLRQELTELLGFAPNIFRFPGGSYCSYGKSIRKELMEEALAENGIRISSVDALSDGRKSVLGKKFEENIRNFLEEL